MIIGIGADCCDVERAAGAKRPEPATYFAGRFAAKEACAKALGSGITERVGWHDIEVLNGSKGHQSCSWGRCRRQPKLMPKEHELALPLGAIASHDPPTALAFVILEARPKT
jgi:holo-[acyl-carrier protein] synthase